MNTKIVSFFLLLFITFSALSQKKKNVLMHINDTPITVSEFERVYNKNLELVQDDSQKTVDGYLQLFIDYKLKVTEARKQGLDKTPSYISEFSKYENQLSRNYLYDSKVTEDLAKEAYNRGQYEINAAHILVKSSFDDTPRDTLKAYNRINEALQKARAGEDFAMLVAKYSEEPGAAERKGDLGYFTTFSMVHQFEEGAYNTSVGEVSDIVRTQFGYHIIKVKDKRKRSNEISVSHIMIVDNKGSKRDFDPKERINEVNTLLTQGTSFESLAKQYSEDRNTGKNGGSLGRFGRGKLRSKIFENEAYKLKNEGDVSAPFKSEFGWHIVRLDKVHTLRSYEEQKEELEKKVAQGDRSKIVVAAVGSKIKEKFGFTNDRNYLKMLQEIVSDSILKRKWEYNKNDPRLQKTLMTIGKEETVTYRDFAAYLSKKQSSRGLPKEKGMLLQTVYNDFEAKKLKEYFRADLEKTNPEYAAVINEYRDGLLIFDVMMANVWDKAKNDSIGLQKYHEMHKEDYIWKERIKATIISSTKKENAQKAILMLGEGNTIDAIKKALNPNKEVNVIISEGTYEVGDTALPENFTTKIGVSKFYEQNDNVIVVRVTEILPSSIKKLEEVKGRVMSDYQTVVEKDWLNSLRESYNIKVHKKALKKIKKKQNK